MTKKELVHKIKETIINGSEQEAIELVDEFVDNEVKELLNKYERFNGNTEKILKIFEEK